MKIKDTIKEMVSAYCREFNLVRHDVGILLFFLFLPLAYPIIYSLIYNPELVKDVPLVVVDHDRTPLSRDLVRKLDACDQASVAGYAADMGEARRAMDSHKVYAILEIPEGFAKTVGRGDKGNVAMYCEMSLLLRYRGFLVAATNVMQDYSTELLAQTIDNYAPLAETIMDGDLLPIDNISMGNIRNGFDSFIMPGVLILILQQCIVLAVGMAGGAAREKKLFTGVNTQNPRTPAFPVMIAQMLCYLTVLVVPIIFIIHYVPLIFRFPMAGDVWQIFAFITPMVLASFGLGFVVQSFVTERETIFVIWVATSLIFLLVSGLIWPLYDMPAVWRWIGYICPSTWGVEGFIKMNANGASLAQVSGPYIHLWILTAFWWIAGYLLRRFHTRPLLNNLKNINDLNMTDN